MNKTSPTNIVQAWKFILCVAGIYGAFIGGGIILEKTLSKEYKGQRNHIHCARLFFQNIILTIISLCVLYFQKKKNIYKDLWNTHYLKISFLLVGSITFANISSIKMGYVLQTLARSSKSLIVVLSIFFSKDKDINSAATKTNIVCGLILTVGIVIFNWTYKSTSLETGIWVGVLCSILSMGLSAFLARAQTKMRAVLTPSVWEFNFYTSFHTMWISLVLTLFSGEIPTIIQFYNEDFEALSDQIKINFCFLFGALFVNATVVYFGNVWTSIITTTRKVFSVFASLMFYGHPLDRNQVIGLSLITGALGIEVATSSIAKMKKKKELERVGQESLQENKDK